MKIDTSQLTIKDGDLIVFKATQELLILENYKYHRESVEWVQKNYPNNKFIFLDKKIDLTVIKAENTRKHKPFKDKIRKA